MAGSPEPPAVAQRRAWTGGAPFRREPTGADALELGVTRRWTARRDTKRIYTKNPNQLEEFCETSLCEAAVIRGYNGDIIFSMQLGW